MGFLDSLVSYFDAHADEPQQAEPEDDASNEEKAKAGEEGDQEEVEDNDKEAADAEGGEGEEEEEEDEEDEDEDEPVDPREAIEAECAKTKECAHHKHEYEDCAARVQDQIESGGKAEEDCVEEFFHMMHCISGCAAPKLFKQLK